MSLPNVRVTLIYYFHSTLDKGAVNSNVYQNTHIKSSKKDLCFKTEGDGLLLAFSGEQKRGESAQDYNVNTTVIAN
jgi:hypothetical protein